MREKTLAGSADWSCVNISSDGRVMAAGVSFGNLYIYQQNMEKAEVDNKPSSGFRYRFTAQLIVHLL